MRLCQLLGGTTTSALVTVVRTPHLLAHAFMVIQHVSCMAAHSLYHLYVCRALAGRLPQQVVCYFWKRRLTSF